MVVATRRLILFMVGASLAGTLVLAGAVHPYSASAVDDAQAQGKVVVLDFHADWCPTCRKQAEALSGLVSDETMKNVAVFRVDFDSADALKKEYGVATQSTLIVLKSGKEVTRAAGIVGREEIRALIDRAL